MTVEEILVDRVAALGPVVAIVGTRVYLDKLPATVTFPAVVVQLVDDLDDYHLRGKNKPQRARVQVDAYAHETSGVDPYAQVTALAEAIDGDGKGSAATGLAGWTGRVGSPPVVIHSCFRTSRLRRYDPDELNLLRMSHDYIVSYTGT